MLLEPREHFVLGDRAANRCCSGQPGADNDGCNSGDRALTLATRRLNERYERADLLADRSTSDATGHERKRGADLRRPVDQARAARCGTYCCACSNSGDDSNRGRLHDYARPGKNSAISRADDSGESEP